MNTQQKILAMLAGSTSQQPMAFADLVSACGLLPATLNPLLVQMAHAVPASINCASITRAGKTRMVYWPTGVIEKAAQPFVINREKSIYGTQLRPALSSLRPQASQVQPSTSISSKEIPMSMPPSKLNTIIYNRIAEQPGIGRDELVKFALQQVPAATDEQAKKAIKNLIYASGKIRSEGARGKPVYYTAEFDGQTAAPALPVSPAVKKQEAKPSVREALYIHEQILQAVLPLLETYDLELIDLIGELNHAAWELSVLNKSGIKKLIAKLEMAVA